MTDLTRRQWLQGTLAACAAGSPALRCLAAAEPAASLPLGFSLYGMKSLPTAEALRACAKIGYDGVELALLPGWPTEPKRLSDDDRRELRKQLADAGLRVTALMENLTEPAEDAVHRSNLERLRAAAELGQVLAPKAVPVIETILGGKPAQWDTVKERMVERLRDWAEVAAASRTVIAIKPHVGNALHTPDGARWLLQQVKSEWIKLAFDYSHFALRNLTLAQTVPVLAPLSAFVHVKDSKGIADKFTFLLPGEGSVDYDEYFKLLRTAGYRGPIVVEVSAQISNKAGYDPVAAAQKSYARLAPALQKAGLRRS
jgi:inosose dehydratase